MKAGSLLIWMRNPNDLNPSFILIHPSSSRVTLLLMPKLLIMLGRLTAEFRPDDLNRTPGMHRPTYPPSFNTNLNHTSLYTVPSMQFGSPPISAFGNTPLHCPAPLS